MAEVLDGADDPALDAHLAVCGACAAEWQQLVVLEALFEAQTLEQPPAGLDERVLHYIEAELARVPAWQRSLLQIGLIVVGVLAFATAVAAFVNGLDVLVVGPILVVWLGALARGAQVALAGAWSGWAEGALAWPVYLTLALAIALAWFGALVIPRAAGSARRIRGA